VQEKKSAGAGELLEKTIDFIKRRVEREKNIQRWEEMITNREG